MQLCLYRQKVIVFLVIWAKVHHIQSSFSNSLIGDRNQKYDLKLLTKHMPRNRCTSCHDCHEFNIICLIFVTTLFPFPLFRKLIDNKKNLVHCSLFGQIHFLVYKGPISRYVRETTYGFRKMNCGGLLCAIHIVDV